MKKPAKRRQPSTPSASTGTKTARFDRERVGKYLRILFELDFIERQLGTAGLTTRAGWLPDSLIFDLIEDEVFASAEDAEAAGDVFINAWYDYRESFGTREAFDPGRLLDWLEAGNFDRHPFRSKPRGLWSLPYDMPVV